MKKIIAYPLSVLHYLLYGFLLVFFHPLQWICIHWIGEKSHERVVNILNFLLVKGLLVSGNRVKFIFEAPIAKNKPIIFAVNHQSVYDIPPLIWYLRDYHPKFVGKKELGGGIPSITINLKNNGSVLIDRSNPRKAIPMMMNFAKYLQENNLSGVIFPEGTRSRDGNPKPFKVTGLQVMIKYMPDALIVPITINNSWKMLSKGPFPIGIGNKLIFKAHKPIAVNGEDTKTLISRVEAIIKNDIII